MRFLPNASHSLLGNIDTLSKAISSYVYCSINKVKLPNITYEVHKDELGNENINVCVDMKPVSVVLWSAFSYRGS